MAIIRTSEAAPMNVDIFKNTGLSHETVGREFVALLSTYGASVHIFAPTDEEARQKAHDFIAAERQRQEKAGLIQEVRKQKRKAALDE